MTTVFVLVVENLHPQHDRDDDRAFVGLFEEEAGDGVGDVVFDVIEVDRLHALRGFLDGLLDDDAGLREEVLRFAKVDEADRKSVV